MKNDYTDFCRVRIDLAKHPLNPRPETEYWTDKVIKEIGERKAAVLDIFTGSGCIGLAVATNCINTDLTLSDKTDYISTALPKNCKFVLSDLFKNISGKFDYILANPPYVPIDKGVEGIMESEPHEALYSGKDGLDAIKLFLKEATKHVSPAGAIWMEFGEGQKRAITDILRDYRYYDHHTCSFHKDQYGKNRWLVIQSQHG